MEDAELIREQAGKITHSGALGRSRSYARLLDFLVACSLQGRTPKELEIAMEVFGRGPDFDPTQDSMVRVYAHNLRQKLDHYYATDGRAERRRLAVSRGEYRVTILTPGNEDSRRDREGPQPARPPRLRFAVAAMALLAVGGLIGTEVGSGRLAARSTYEQVAESPIWTHLLDDDLPTLIVVGDYYIFGELDKYGNVRRLVRDFSVNSSKDLDSLAFYDPDLADRNLDLDLTYLPRGTAFALVDVLRILYTSPKPVHVVSMSELNVAELKANHIVYVGYISALDKLEDLVFASSGLAVGETYDELRSKQTGELYASEAGLPADPRNYRDYGFLSTFPGPGGNQFVVIAGTRDAGLMQAAHAVTDPMFVRSVEQAMPDGTSRQAPAFEQLYEVMGFDRTNLDAMLVHASVLNYQEIWGGNLLQPD